MEKRIKEEEDYIFAPKFGNSLNKLLAKSEKTWENKGIARLLLTTEKEVEKIYEESVIELRKELIKDGEIESQSPETE